MLIFWIVQTPVHPCSYSVNKTHARWEIGSAEKQYIFLINLVDSWNLNTKSTHLISLNLLKG